MVTMPLLEILTIALDRAIDPILIIAVILLRLNFRNEYVLVSGGICIAIACQAMAMRLAPISWWPGLAATLIVSVAWILVSIEVGKVVERWVDRNWLERQPLPGLAICFLILIGLSLVVAPGALLVERRALSSPITIE